MFRAGSSNDLEVATDSSFSPGGGLSHGSVVAMVGGTPILWTSSKQPLPCLSTAESELVEAIEGVILGDSLACLVEEVEGKIQKTLKCDNAAAVSLSTAKGGAWRTRHLRVRAAHLRWRIDSDEWKMEHQYGKSLVADLGTKVLSAHRVKDLMEKMNLAEQPRAVDQRVAAELQEEYKEENVAWEENREPLPSIAQLVYRHDLQRITKLVTVIMALEKIKGAVAQAEDDAGRDGNLYLQAFAVIVMMCGIAIWEIAKKILALCTAQSEVPAVVEQEAPPQHEEPRVATMRLRRPGTCQAAGSAALRRDPWERAEEMRHLHEGDDGPQQLHREVPHRREVEQLHREVPHRQGVENLHPEVPRREGVEPLHRGHHRHEDRQGNHQENEEPAQTLEEGVQPGRALPVVGPIITPTGKKFHRSGLCPTLECSKKIRKQGCGTCAHRYAATEWVWKDEEEVVHFERHCPRLQGSMMPYEECLKCGRLSGLS